MTEIQMLERSVMNQRGGMSTQSSFILEMPACVEDVQEAGNTRFSRLVLETAG